MNYEDLIARLDFFYLTYQYDDFVELYQLHKSADLEVKLRSTWQSEELWSRLLAS